MALRRFDWLRERGPGDKAVRRGGPASARLQAALFRIADLTLACEDLDALYRSIHQVVAELMDATNFYIAVYDEPADTLSFPYFVDQYDPKPERRRPGKTLTAYVLRTGEPLIANAETFADLVACGEVESIGAPSVDWVGVPLKAGGTTFGILGVQSYDPAVRFGQHECDILMFVSQHVATAIAAKRRDDAVRESERRYRQLFDNNTAIKLVIEPESGAILDANLAAASFYGYAKEQLQTMRIWDINVRGETNVRDDMVAALRQKKNTFLFRHRVASGEIRDVEVHSGPIEMKGRTVLYSIINDVTERLRAEAALRESESYFRTVIENASDVVAILEPNGRIVYNSPSIETVLGYKADRTIGSDILEFIHEDDAPAVRATLARLAAGEDAEPIELRLRHRDGAWRILEAAGRRIPGPRSDAVRIVTNCRDVTDRKAAQQALEASETKYRSIFDFAPVGIYQSSADGRLITANATLAQMLGYDSVNELLDVNLAEEVYFDPTERNVLIDRHAPAGSSGELEIVWKRKDGTPIWVQLNAHAIKDDHGLVLHFEGFVTDINERKTAETTLRTQAVAMQASMDGIAILDRDRRLTWVNHAFLKLFRYRSANELIGHP